jgi:DNA-directed RNA polymerase specialized sigma subunit
MTREDLRQEGLIALYEAGHEYDARRGRAFDKFASTCVYKVHRARRDARRLKHQVLSDAL